MAYNKPKFFDFLILYSILLLDRHNCLASDSAVRFGFSFSNSTIFFCVLFSCSSSFVCLRVTTSLDVFWINSEVSSKLFRSFSEVIPKLFRSFSEVIPKLFRSYSEVSPKFLRSYSEVLLPYCCSLFVVVFRKRFTRNELGVSINSGAGSSKSSARDRILLRYRELGKTFLYFHFSFHVPEIVAFK